MTPCTFSFSFHARSTIQHLSNLPIRYFLETCIPTLLALPRNIIVPPIPMVSRDCFIWIPRLTDSAFSQTI